MKKLLLLLSLACTLVYGKTGVTYDTKILRVIDGDTVAIEALYLPDPLKKELLVRIHGVDTPEKGFRAKCESEKVKGNQASAYTKSLINKSKDIKVTIIDWDKYGGRILGDIILDGVSLRQSLIAQGYAKEYYGAKKSSWC